MESLRRIGMVPASLSLSADDVVEFHAARILLLFYLCGVANRIDGLTKFAKLDFFARYPDFFEEAKAQELNQNVPMLKVARPTESAMVRHHYGPWDKRYYHVLAVLESKGLLTVAKEGKSYRLALTDTGAQKAAELAAVPSYAALVTRMKDVKKTFGNRNGAYLKDLIYRVFKEEVGQRPLGTLISR